MSGPAAAMPAAEWVGWAGGFLSAVQLIPQILRIQRTRSAGDLSRWSFAIRLTAYALYLVHGRNIQDPPLFWMTLMGTILLCITIAQMAWYSPKKKPDAETPKEPEEE